MPTKPTLLNTWASGSPANRADPGGSKINTGWIPGEKPPAEWFNFWMHNVYSWVGYVNQLGASDVPASYSGATTTVQAAIDGLGAQIAALPLPGTVGLTHVTPPSLNSTTPDLWSGASGGICVPFVYPNGVVSSALYPEYAAQDLQVVTATTWPASDGVGAGKVFKNLDVRAPVTVSELVGPFVLRVHGDLQIHSTLSFFGDGSVWPTYTALMSAGMNQVPAYWDNVGKVTYGGAGTMASGGSGGVHPTKWVWGGLVTDTFQTLNNRGRLGMRTDALLDLITTLPGMGSVGELGQLIQGGGMAGAAGDPRIVTAYNAGGGFAVLYVSGDIIFGPNGSVSCSGAPGSSTWNGAPISKGGGGGGGGALIVICGGRIRTPSAGGLIPLGAFRADGGDGGGGVYFGGGGGGGGFVYLCSRNAHPVQAALGQVSARAGVGGSSSGGPGVAGEAGRVVIFRAVPRLMA